MIQISSDWREIAGRRLFGDLDIECYDDEGQLLRLRGPVEDVKVEISSGKVLVSLEWLAKRRIAPHKPGPFFWTHEPDIKTLVIGPNFEISFRIESSDRGERVNFGNQSYLFLDAKDPLDPKEVVGLVVQKTVH